MSFFAKVGAAVLVVSSVGLVGCTSPPKKQIELTPLDCSVAGNNPKVLKKAVTGATIEIPMRAINNNPIAVSLDTLAIDGTINGTSIGSCEPLKQTVIAAGSTAQLHLIYHVSTLGGGLGVLEAIAAGKVTVELTGNGHISSADGAYAGDKDFPLQLK
jgi:hypothetical protein